MSCTAAAPGSGAQGRVSLNDIAELVSVGSLKYVSISHYLPAELSGKDTDHLCTNVYVGWNGAVQGRISLEDRIRPEAIGGIVSLKDMGLRIAIISGDQPIRLNSLRASWE